MTTITVTKDDTGKLVGCTEADQRAWLRFSKLVRDLGIGEFFEIDYWFPRNGPFHRMHFKMLTTIYDNQERFDDRKMFRFWIQVGAGHCKFAPGADGHLIPIPDSISYRRLDDEQFREHHERVKEFLRGEHAQHFLWPHLSADKQANKVEEILSRFEQPIERVPYEP